MAPPTSNMSLLVNANKSRYLIIYLTGIFCLAALGCGTKSPITKDIVGTWTFDQAAPGLEALAYFNSDGTYRFTFIGNKIDNAVSGTYKLTNDKR